MIPLERLLLNGDEVGQLHRRGDLAEAHAARDVGGGDGRVCGTHRAFPPYNGIQRQLSQGSNLAKNDGPVNEKY